MSRNELNFMKVKELITKHPERYINITKIANDVGINWRTAQKYVKRLGK